mmetsp:Transcript_15370/g.23002  ORF Transcript_15370/g.23002 Transcript_15370/m.23002 type:complete len:202 (-) Transcript_15370:192-797(-)
MIKLDRMEEGNIKTPSSSILLPLEMVVETSSISTSQSSASFASQFSPRSLSSLPLSSKSISFGSLGEPSSSSSSKSISFGSLDPLVCSSFIFIFIMAICNDDMPSYGSTGATTLTFTFAANDDAFFFNGVITVFFPFCSFVDFLFCSRSFIVIAEVHSCFKCNHPRSPNTNSSILRPGLAMRDIFAFPLMEMGVAFITTRS